MKATVIVELDIATSRWPRLWEDLIADIPDVLHLDEGDTAKITAHLHSTEEMVWGAF